VEAHDEQEIERALRIEPRIIGVNNRNLMDFSISLETTKRLRKYVPSDKVFIAESGIMGDADVAFLKEVGVDGFLIGRAFMEAENPRELASRWKAM
jgi:indole-3-glycerol phosphate synthase